MNNMKQTNIDDEKLDALLATLRHEPTPEADFESRFIADFHKRLAEARQQQPEPFMARVRSFFASVWRNKAVYGTSFAALCLLCVTYVAWTPVPSGDGAASNASHMAPAFNAQMVTPASMDDARNAEAPEDARKEDELDKRLENQN